MATHLEKKIGTRVTGLEARLDGWFDQRTPALWPLGFALVGGGWALLWFGFTNPNSFFVLAGAVAVLAGLKTVNRLVRPMLDERWMGEYEQTRRTARQTRRQRDKIEEGPDRDTRKKATLWGIGVLGLGAAVVVLANLLRNPLVAVVGVTILLLSAGPFSLLLFYWRDGSNVIDPRRIDDDDGGFFDHFFAEVARKLADPTVTDSTVVPRRWVLGGIGTGVAAVLVFLLLPGGWSLVALPVLLAGLLAYQIGLPGICKANTIVRWAGAPTAHETKWADATEYFPGDCRWDAGRVAVFGVLMVLLGWWLGGGLAVALILFGGLFLVLAVIALGFGFKISVRPEQKASWACWWFAVGVAGFLLVGLVLLAITRGDDFGGAVGTATAIAVVLALIGASLVWQGEGLFFAALAGFVLVFATSTTAEPDNGLVSGTGDEVVPAAGEAGRTQPAATDMNIVVFGDSWISGEGTKVFYEGTDDENDDVKNACRRSPDAYPLLLAGELQLRSGQDVEVDFYACSGAKMEHLVGLDFDGQGNMPEPSPGVTYVDAESYGPGAADECKGKLVGDNLGDGEDARAVSQGQMPVGPDDVYGRHRQICYVDNDVRPDLVLVSVGGNDSGFGDVVKGCVMPGSCVERREDWLENIASLGPDLDKTYTRIRNAYGGEDAPPIVVMPYPLVMTESGCNSSPLRAAEHAFLVEFTTVLNEQLKVSAGRAGVHYLERGMYAHAGHRICQAGQDNRAVNLIEFQSSEGGFLDRINPSHWLNNSMHPNQLGHQLYFDALYDWLVEEGIVVDGVLREGTENPVAVEDALVVEGVRPIRPFPIDTATLFPDGEPLPDGLRDLVEGGQIDGFATQTILFDDPARSLDESGSLLTKQQLEQLEGGGDDAPTLDDRWWPAPIIGAATVGTVYYTDQTGAWVAVEEIATVDEESGSPIADAGPVYARADDLYLKASRPAEKPGSVYEQWVVFQVADDAAGTADPAWELRAVRFCSTTDRCSATFDEWFADRVDAAIWTAGPWAVLLVIGGWLFAIGWVLGIRPWIDRRLELTPVTNAPRT